MLSPSTPISNVKLTYGPLAGGWLSGRYRKGREISGPGSVARQRRFPAAFDATSPANAAKLNAADALGALADEAGMTLIQMAIAFVTRHPAVTSAITGPRTMDHLERDMTVPISVPMMSAISL